MYIPKFNQAGDRTLPAVNLDGTPACLLYSLHSTMHLFCSNTIFHRAVPGAICMIPMRIICHNPPAESGA